MQAMKTRCWARRCTAKSLACSRAASRSEEAAPPGSRRRELRFMEFGIKGGSPWKERTGCLVVGIYEGRKLSPAAMEVDAASGHALDAVLRRGDLEGELG